MDGWMREIEMDDVARQTDRHKVAEFACGKRRACRVDCFRRTNERVKE